jgi:uncharacterized protein YjbI with pentapeptide repeats
MRVQAVQTLIQWVGLAALIFTGIYTLKRATAIEEQVKVDREGSVTERFSRAVEQLGKPGEENVHIRVGGIYALGQIGRDYPRDYYLTVMRILTAFLRQVRWLPAEPTEREGDMPEKAGPVQGPKVRQVPEPPVDVQAAIDVIRERNVAYERRALPSFHLDLHGAHLARANLSEADLRSACLQRADLCRARLEKADLSGALLQESDLSGAYLEAAALPGATLSKADLSGADLIEANCLGARMRECDLSGAELYGANLSGTYLLKANLSGASLMGASLRDAVLRLANLSGAELWDADFAGAHLEGANLSNSQLKGAKLSGADLRRADLGVAILNGVDLSGVLNLTREQLDSAICDQSTILPTDLVKQQLPALPPVEQPPAQPSSEELAPHPAEEDQPPPDEQPPELRTESEQ